MLKLGATLIAALVAGILLYGADAITAGEPDRRIRVFDRIVIDDDTAYLGVTMHDSEDTDGVEIAKVMDDSPAERAGLETGDVVVEVDGRDVRDARQLARRIHRLEPGDLVDIEVLRDGRRVTLEAELDSHPGIEGLDLDLDLEPLLGMTDKLQLELDDLDLDDIHDLGDRIRAEVQIHTCENDDCSRHFWGWSSRPLLGVELSATTPELREHLGGSRDAGVLVNRVEEDSPAEEAGIEVGDLIVAIGGERVASVHEIRGELRAHHGERVEIELVRDGRRVVVDADLPERDTNERSALESLEDLRRSLEDSGLKEIQRELQKLHGPGGSLEKIRETAERARLEV